MTTAAKPSLTDEQCDEICESCPQDKFGFVHPNDVIRAAFAAGAAAVPREPTREMIKSAMDYYESTHWTTIRLNFVDMWRAMYDAAPARQDQHGGQEHEAAARCPLEDIAPSEATCLNTGPSGRIGSDTQQGKLGADAGSIPAPPTTSPDPTPAPEPQRDELVHKLRVYHNSEGKRIFPVFQDLCWEAAARITSDAAKLAAQDERIRELGDEVQQARDFALGAIARAEAAESRVRELEAKK